MGGWRFAAALAACAALAGCAAPGPAAGPASGGSAGAGAGCQLSLAATVPLTFAAHASKLLVPVSMDGSKLTMIVDTGSEGILLTRAAAQRAGREVGIGTMIGGTEESGRAYDTGIGGSTYVTGTTIDDLAIGRMHGAFNAHVTDNLFPGGSMGVDGLLGMALLANFDIDFDLAGGQLRLYSAKGACDAPAVALGQPIYAVKLAGGYRSELQARVPVTINGQVFHAVLDSGANGIVLFRHTGAMLGLVPGQAPRGRIAGIAGFEDANRYQIDRLSVGPLTLRHVHVAVVDQDMQQNDLLLGLSFMKQVHVWLSNSSHSLVMQYPPAASPAIDAPDQVSAASP